MSEKKPGQERESPLGVRAVEKGYCTEGQVLDALRAQYRARVEIGRHLFIGEVLLLRGALTTEQLTELLGEDVEKYEEASDLSANKQFFGDVAIQLGYVTAQAVFEALNEQYHQDRRTGKHQLIGELLVANGHMTLEQIDEVVAQLARLRKR